jgi:hypothetical protein
MFDEMVGSITSKEWKSETVGSIEPNEMKACLINSRPGDEFAIGSRSSFETPSNNTEAVWDSVDCALYISIGHRHVT